MAVFPKAAAVGSGEPSRSKAPPKKKVSFEEERLCLAENPFEALVEVLPMLRSLIWCRSKGHGSTPVLLHSEEEPTEEVPYVITTDSSEDDVSTLHNDPEPQPLPPLFYQQQDKKISRRFTVLLEMAKQQEVRGETFLWDDDSFGSDDSNGMDVFLNQLAPIGRANSSRRRNKRVA